jgi:hypothetical protein
VDHLAKRAGSTPCELYELSKELHYLTPPPPWWIAGASRGQRGQPDSRVVVVSRSEVSRVAGEVVPHKPKLLVRVREAIWTRQYSPRTEQAYVQWIRRYIFFHKLRHPAELGALTRFRRQARYAATPAACCRSKSIGLR